MRCSSVGLDFTYSIFIVFWSLRFFVSPSVALVRAVVVFCRVSFHCVAWYCLCALCCCCVSSLCVCFFFPVLSCVALPRAVVAFCRVVLCYVLSCRAWSVSQPAPSPQ